MCVIVIMTFILVRTDSPMCLSFRRQMFSRLVIWVDSNWGKRTAWAMYCSLLFHSFFLLFSLLSFLFPSLGCLLGRSLTDHSSCCREAPWPSEFILLCHLSEHRRRLGQGSEFISAQQHFKQFDDDFHPHTWYQLKTGLDAYAYRQCFISDSLCIS